MTRVYLVLFALLLVSGCSTLPLGLDELTTNPGRISPPPAENSQSDVDTTPVVAAPPPADATTVEEFDTTTEEARTAAVTEPRSGRPGRLLGTTVASLGDVADPGIWLKTPLVSDPSKGRIEEPISGTWVNVDLIPIEGDAGAGSRLSLAAMRLLQVELTSLPEVEVYTVTN